MTLSSRRSSRPVRLDPTCTLPATVTSGPAASVPTTATPLLKVAAAPTTSTDPIATLPLTLANGPVTVRDVPMIDPTTTKFDPTFSPPVKLPTSPVEIRFPAVTVPTTVTPALKVAAPPTTSTEPTPTFPLTLAKGPFTVNAVPVIDPVTNEFPETLDDPPTSSGYAGAAFRIPTSPPGATRSPSVRPGLLPAWSAPVFSTTLPANCVVAPGFAVATPAEMLTFPPYPTSPAVPSFPRL